MSKFKVIVDPTGKWYWGVKKVLEIMTNDFKEIFIELKSKNMDDLKKEVEEILGNYDWDIIQSAQVCDKQGYLLIDIER